MRKPAQLKKPNEPKPVDRTYQLHSCDIIAYGGDGERVICTGLELIERIQEFAREETVDVKDIEIFSDVDIMSGYYDDTYLGGSTRLRVLKEYTWSEEELAPRLEKYEARMKTYREKLAFYEAELPAWKAKMAEYVVWKAEKTKKDELKALRKLQKKYPGGV
jgi:hypothetical protein